jgi:uncharacterized membrane protein YeaQ/YmgE (transglycosylase-associated protein family)
MVTFFAAVALDPGGIVSWLIIGGLAGWITGRIVGGGWGFIGDILVGILGAFVGGILTSLVTTTSFGFWGTLAVAIVGSVVLTLVVRLIRRGAATPPHDGLVTPPAMGTAGTRPPPEGVQ